MRLNLGCGATKLPGWVNCDKVPDCNPEQVVDLEKFPWPWPDSSAEEVLLSHVLEHLGQATEVYLGIVKELYRVCRDGAAVSIIVPHPRHDHFLTDPTHVRPITPDGLRMFSQAVNREWIAKQGANTPLALYLGVDFEIETIDMTLAEPWIGRLERSEITEAELEYAARTFNNVVQQTKIVLRAIKPPGRSR